MENTLINRVANSGIKTINLEKFYPQVEISHIDLTDYLFQGLILREKEFRQAIKEHDWSQYKNQILLVYCTTDAIIPVWAYMLVSAAATPFAKEIFQGTEEQYLIQYYTHTLARLDLSEYQDERVVIKGCSDRPVPVQAYALIVNLLSSLAQSIMYGEPCSTVPIFKRPRVV